MRGRAAGLVIAVLLMVSVRHESPSASYYAGGQFLETVVASGLIAPTAMEILSDGRLLVAEAGGHVRVFKDGIRRTQPFVTVTTPFGLLGITTHPGFASNQFVYLHYINAAGRNRISRVTANGDVAVDASEVVLFEAEVAFNTGTTQRGGPIRFGPDGRLYVALGDYTPGISGQNSSALSLNSLTGKILRLNADGTIPGDNPFFGTAIGQYRSIWAAGLHNPRSITFHRTTGQMFISDHGPGGGEINIGVAGASYGWPVTYGYTTDPRFVSPLFAYPYEEFHCGMNSGAPYDPVTPQFPEAFRDNYIYSDICNIGMLRYDPATNSEVVFANNFHGTGRAEDLRVMADGSVYVLGFTRVVRLEHNPGPRERISIGVGGYSGDGGLLSVRTGRFGGFALTTGVQVPWPAYTATGGGVRLATGDLDGDGLDEIVAGLERGGGGWMAIFDDAAHGHRFLRWVQVPWLAYNAANGEVFPAVGNLDDDPADEIVAGLGTGSSGFYAIFDDGSTNHQFTAWRQVQWPDYNVANGTTHPSIGDVDGDGYGEIVLGLSSGSAGWLAIVEAAPFGFAHRRWLQVHWPTYAATGGGTWPAAGDVDADGRAEVVIGLERGGGGWVEVMDDATKQFTEQKWVRLSWPEYNEANGETHPAVGNVDDDAGAEIVVGHAATAANGTWVEIFEGASPSFIFFNSLGWRNADWPTARTAGAASFPAVGRLR